MPRPKLTPAEITARRVERKRADLQRRELAAVGGPNSLFRDDAETVTTEQAAWHVQRNHAVGVEGRHRGPWDELVVGLDLLRLAAVERFAATVMTPYWFRAVQTRIRETWSGLAYQLGVWRRVLTGGEKLVTAFGWGVWTMRPVRWKVVNAEVFPPAEWVVPLTGEEFEGRFGVVRVMEEPVESVVLFEEVMGKIRDGCKRC